MWKAAKLAFETRDQAVPDFEGSHNGSSHEEKEYEEEGLYAEEEDASPMVSAKRSSS